MTDEPTTYNELVELIENNDPGAAAQVIQQTHTPNEDLQGFISHCETRAAEQREKPMELFNGIAVGRKRSATELQELIDGDTE